MSLLLDTGLSTLKGKQDENKDACLVAAPGTNLDGLALIAVADSISGYSDEESPASTCINTLKESFFSAPENLDIESTLEESFAVVNSAISNLPGGASSTLSALVFNDTSWQIAHVGDTRVWLLRDQKIKQLTRDHIQHKMPGGTVVNNACGKSKTIEIDTYSGDLQEGDIFLLTTNGIHDVLGGTSFMGCMLMDKPAQEIADCITRLALEQGSKDCVSACIAKIDYIDGQKTATRKQTKNKATTNANNKEEDKGENKEELPIVAYPEKGSTVDNFYIEGPIHKSSMYVLYKAVDQESGESVVLKFPHPKYGGNKTFIENYLNEEWRARRLDNPHIAKVLPLKQGRRTALYSLMEYHKGESLAKRIKRKKQLSVRESLYLARQLLDCLQYLHEKGIIHLDIKPKNILIDKKNKRILLTSLGLCTENRIESESNLPSYKNYSAPELLSGNEKNKRSDIYSVGVILYKMLTGHYPYGRIKSHEDFSSRDFTPPEKYNAQIPAWLSDIVKKACAVRPESRYKEAATLSEEIYYVPDDMHKSKKKGFLKTLSQHWEQTLIISLVINLIIIIAWILQ